MGKKMMKNGKILPKNDPNDLKFWHKMYLDGFHWFAKFWKISAKIGQFLAKKDQNFCRFFQKKRFLTSEKSWIYFFNNGPIGLKFGVHDPWGCF